MTYWYLGIKEVVDDIRTLSSNTKIILGGNYATPCPEHAQTLDPDLIIKADHFDPLWKLLNTQPDLSQPALWESYSKVTTAAIKLTDGCPFKCTYCSIPKVYKKFKPRPLDRCLKELELLNNLGAKNIAFYDDALLYKPEEILIPFLNEAIKNDYQLNFHSPNALNARFITKPIADLMVKAGFKTFYLGFESSSEQFQKQTGSKVFSSELAQAVKLLTNAGANTRNITAYQILGHPFGNLQQLEDSMHFANSLGMKNMLADFSPILNTPDGEYCKKYIDLTDPLNHNKAVFPTTLLGFEETNRLKNLCQILNYSLH